MEDVLYQYALPYDPLRPQLCFDERPCFLIGDVGSILPMSPGKAKRYHDEYEKHGSCCVFLAFEPHTVFRYVEVRERRTAVDDAQFMQNLLDKQRACRLYSSGARQLEYPYPGLLFCGVTSRGSLCAQPEV